MNSHTQYEANNMSYLDYIKKRGGNVPNVSEIEDTVLQDGVDIDAMFSGSSLHKYYNI